ncbi:hypothetical protein [Microbacterium suwonense]|uniref:Lipoprotein n=1 Tax=Microbacterium suwonense TaxID=683047 RepID=A0ABM8FW79_9MICO|nr:hypothetical protein [Microbacterium suwonense]BDZ39926.1 hypothetical protein GCM10025863_25400 [Microbacterium suwonense]
MTARIPVLASLALSSLLLAGCAPQSSEVLTPSQSQTADPTPAPEETQIPEEVTGQPGDPLTAEEAKQLNGQRGTLRPYEMNDGSYVVIDVKQPLPEPVKHEVADSLGSVGNDTSSALGQLDRETSTGKTIIMVRQIHYSSATGGDFFGWHAASYANGFPGFQGGDASSVASQAQAWANSQRDPAQFEVIVVNN